MESIQLSFKGDDLGWGISGLGDDLGFGGGGPRDAQVCGGGSLPLGLLEEDITMGDESVSSYFVSSLA